LGFEPYPGTLNVKLNEPLPEIGKGRKMYNFICYPGSLMVGDFKTDAYICKHPYGEGRTVFVLAPVGIRKTFGLRDKGFVRVQVGKVV